MLKQNSRAQALLEYSLLISVVIMVAMTMYTRVKRQHQSIIKIVADQIGDQRNAEQSYTYNDSYIIFSDSRSATKTNKETIERSHKSYYYQNETTVTDTISLTNTGFTPDD